MRFFASPPLPSPSSSLLLPSLPLLSPFSLLSRLLLPPLASPLFPSFLLAPFSLLSLLSPLSSPFFLLPPIPSHPLSYDDERDVGNEAVRIPILICDAAGCRVAMAARLDTYAEMRLPSLHSVDTSIRLGCTCTQMLGRVGGRVAFSVLSHFLWDVAWVRIA